MRDVPGHQNHADHVRRKPLAPLPDELSGPVRDFVSSLRRMHGELGYSLKELESRLPASRSSLSRYLRGQSLPDERLLVQWCTLSFTGEDRLPALVDLLHRAQEAADAGARATERDGTPDGETRVDTDASPGAGAETEAAATGGRRGRLVLAGLGTAAVLIAAALAVPALISSNGSPDSGSDGRAPGAKSAASATGSARLTVHNVERDCQHRRTENCTLGLARDPYRLYRRSNVVGHVWHGEVLRAVCRIANGITVTDEVGGHSSMWFRVEHDGDQVWMPAIRIRPEQVENTTLPGCPG
ncbi:helix-turn-helix transcriptional regulator [Streptomyces platensis]|uniref:helix-turn-helix domain-containing protein n=1 Tax=Streptomyces platensis TaxID=58346 RepID=UPI00225445E9|nr:helix-turn-helix transcriptional regulator [Streptomyces platensis]MCX4639327.1 helix-turn-helix transcriptional regulator [Streptomyces platensis]